MIRLIYNLLWPLGMLIFLPGYFAKMIRRGGYREKFGQRLGMYDAALRKRLSDRRFDCPLRAIRQARRNGNFRRDGLVQAKVAQHRVFVHRARKCAGSAEWGRALHRQRFDSELRPSAHHNEPTC